MDATAPRGDSPRPARQGGGTRIALYWEAVRPFTLLPPLLGMLSGALCALGARAFRSGSTPVELLATDSGGFARAIVLGAVMAATLNAGSNVLNQMTDLANDRRNKPQRPLPSGRMSLAEAGVLTVVLYAMALVAAWLVRAPGVGRTECFWIALGGAALSVAYSAPPLRTKRWAWPAQSTIALSRGMLLRACGWSCVAAAFSDPEPWFTGIAFYLFVLGASATKDFADVEGDREAGCFTWPVVHGPAGAARRVAPFLVLPWVVLPVGLVLRHPAGGALLGADAVWVGVLCAALAVYGVAIGRTLQRDTAELARVENHPSWVHMYRQMMLAQVGLAVAYLVGG